MAADPSPKTPNVEKRKLKSTRRKGGVAPLQKGKSRAKWIWGSVIGLVILIVIVALTPPFGTARFGICKIFVEMSDPYPEFLEFVQAYEEDVMVVLDYNRTDSFGQRSLNQIRCIFKSDDPYLLSRVDINGRSRKYGVEEPAYIDKFNKGVPSILANSPSLKLPPGLAEEIKDYR